MQIKAEKEIIIRLIIFCHNLKTPAEMNPYLFIQHSYIQHAC